MSQQANLPSAIDSMLVFVKHLADSAQDIAKAKRQLFEAYVQEGFTEQQALELVKGMTGII